MIKQRFSPFSMFSVAAPSLKHGQVRSVNNGEQTTPDFEDFAYHRDLYLSGTILNTLLIFSTLE